MRNKKTKQKNETQTQLKKSAEGADGSQGDVTLSAHLPLCVSNTRHKHW